MYRRPRRREVKKDGTLRDTWDALPQLKALQELINKRFLRQVSFPHFLQGGIRDLASPRDYVRHVGFHAGTACAIALDIADFFPSISEVQVYAVWQGFFRFSADVAHALTKLTTKDGFLPQGAKTSNYLANLVFWRDEHSLVHRLKVLGWRYSRLTDDVVVSKAALPTPGEETRICRLVAGFIQAQGFVVNRRKLKVTRQCRRMELNGLVANVRPALPKAERNAIRAQVHGLKRHLANPQSLDTSAARSTLGRLGKLRRLHEKEGKALRATLPDNVERLVRYA